MKALSILDEVVFELEQDVNISRIKRIIFFACKEFWENDVRQLASTDLGILIQEMCAKYSKLEDIEAVLNNIVSKVNKKTEYALVADLIICQLSRLYEFEDFTNLETSISRFGGQNAPAFQDEFSSQIPSNEESQRNPGNLFDVRQKILQQTNPLRAKILIFSTLYHEFTFSDRDWLLLKTQELDTLLRQLFNVCPTLVELESQLYRTVNNLENTNENDSSASVIIKAMSPCYANIQQEKRDRAEDAAREDFPSEDCDQTRLINNVDEKANQSESRSNYLETGDITHIIQAAPAHYHDDPQNSYLVPRVAEPSQFQQAEISSNSLTHNFKHELPKTVQYQENSTITEISVPSAATINISESIKQKLGLEEEIKSLVIESANFATTKIENIFSDLESALNRQFSTESPEERLYWKYKVLRDYVGEVQGFTYKLIKILSELESKERGQSTLETQPNFEQNVSSETEPNKSSHKQPNQQQILAMAKQGNPKAIAILINQLLQPKGITAIAGFKDGCLHVIVESAPAPNQQDTATYIYKKLCTLKAKFINNVKIYGRELGNKTILWTQEFVDKNN
ncbi:MAG: hypothetical protein QQW96_18145 [Tychonema bourrellyi B0820]|uniref:Uncharacterized protein n=1 Tax=Tychonema bourrellyi FEM_GT703 TaxID=2040638 RepID=A0A2G4F338_9CYAN|nr:hypothetical protein [Tychonema bourrellyi]MDQ2099556.1 hypothetical protein [Tychonema bourrellyi B0820]PHX56172.1 hypothetical protein CP500_006935 [Tychonema bourrellyi FEM_GT703]